MVQFAQTGKVDHAVCVNGKRGLVWDYKETSPLELNADSLPLCSGVKSKKARVHVTEMIAQGEKKKTNGALEVTELE